MNVLFVCTGNTCRSPMAEGIFKKMLADKGVEGVNASSAGIFAMSGDAACENAERAAECFGADISDHRARRLTAYLIDETDVFVCMTSNHAVSLANYVDSDKIIVLNEIPDPFGGNLEIYITCANLIKKGLESVFDEIVGRA